MTDARKALEAAADAIYRDMFPERDGLAMETDAECCGGLEPNGKSCADASKTEIR